MLTSGRSIALQLGLILAMSLIVFADSNPLSSPSVSAQQPNDQITSICASLC